MRPINFLCLLRNLTSLQDKLTFCVYWKKSYIFTRPINFLCLLRNLTSFTGSTIFFGLLPNSRSLMDFLIVFVCNAIVCLILDYLIFHVSNEMLTDKCLCPLQNLTYFTGPINVVSIMIYFTGPINQSTVFDYYNISHFSFFFYLSIYEKFMTEVLAENESM